MAITTRLTTVTGCDMLSDKHEIKFVH